MEDLDRLQGELEMLLSNVALRQRTLHSEIALIASAEENKTKKTASISIVKSVSSPDRYHIGARIPIRFQLHFTFFPPTEEI